MNNKDTLRKLHFNIKLSGWLGAFPAVVMWNIYKASGELMYLLLAIAPVILSLYILITSDSEMWQKRSKVTSVAIFSIMFAGVLSAIPLFIALRYTDKTK